MEISALGAPQTGSGADQALTGLADSFDTFLTLLTTQLQHQDPLDPMDSSEFTQQLVQFTQVEQSISANKNLEQLISLFSAQNLTNLVGYLGKEVEIQTDEAALVNGQANWNYDFEGIKPEAVAITIFDDAGRVVTAAQGIPSPGKQTFAWDGTDLLGNPVADGVYRATIVGTTLDGSALEPKLSSNGTVTSVENIDGEATLDLSGLQIPADQVIKISDLPANGGTGP